MRDPASCTGDKWKVYCARCFELHIVAIQKEHEKAAENGISLNLPQTWEGIESYCACLISNHSILFIMLPVWAIKAEDQSENIGRGWRRSATSTLLNHIANCTLQDTDIRWAAFYSPSAKKATGTSPV
jgi:hypothetical protein